MVFTFVLLGPVTLYAVQSIEHIQGNNAGKHPNKKQSNPYIPPKN